MTIDASTIEASDSRQTCHGTLTTEEQRQLAALLEASHPETWPESYGDPGKPDQIRHIVSAGKYTTSWYGENPSALPIELKHLRDALWDVRGRVGGSQKCQQKDDALHAPRMIAMQNYLWFVLAAACEIAGCYTAWLWLRLGRSAWWLIPGAVSLAVFAIVLTRVETAFAGRAFAAYGGIYIVSALVWLAVIERTLPRWTDMIGSALCLAGAAVILFGPAWHQG